MYLGQTWQGAVIPYFAVVIYVVLRDKINNDIYTIYMGIVLRGGLVARPAPIIPE